MNDILAGDEVMREADLTNQKTFAADHHDQTIEETQRGFRKLRGQLIACIDSLDTNQYSATALHPRLMQPMRIVDLCYFVAEHDDYHLARMAYLKHC